MSLRRYTPMKPSAGERIPDAVSDAVRLRDGGRCVGPLVGMTPPCQGSVERDHVRASGAVGKKSESSVENLVLLCGIHHRTKTENGRVWRPLLLDYIAGRE